jgi:hypothetical protein
MAEQMIKEMGQMPGLSRERILGQLEREYEVDIAMKLADFETKGEANGFPGRTFLEVQGAMMMETFRHA